MKDHRAKVLGSFDILWCRLFLSPRGLTAGRQKNLGSLLGFSLLELMVVLVLLGGLVAIVIPSFSALSGLEQKNEVTRLAGLFSEVYALAAISGKTHRIVLDLDAQKYWVEEKEGELFEIKPELGYEDLMREKIKKNIEDEDAAKQFLPTFKEVEGRLGEKNELPTDLVIHGAWTEQMSEVARVGQISIYFFGGGYTQSAFVSLAKKGNEVDSAMYLAISPLTGSIEINLGEPDINQLLSAESEK